MRCEESGWGGWTRTNTVLINSEVSYQLDHAPTSGATGTPILSDFLRKILWVDLSDYQSLLSVRGPTNFREQEFWFSSH